MVHLQAKLSCRDSIILGTLGIQVARASLGKILLLQGSRTGMHMYPM